MALALDSGETVTDPQTPSALCVALTLLETLHIVARRQIIRAEVGWVIDPVQLGEIMPIIRRLYGAMENGMRVKG